MLDNHGSMIRNDILEAFDTAVTNPENINSSGGINWNYVDADIHMELSAFYASSYLDECMEVLVNNYFDKM